MYDIAFNTHVGGYRVSEDLFGRIKAMVLGNRECERCHTVITPENPHVCLNVCLSCFMDREGKEYEFVGPTGEKDKYDSEYFHFLDQWGYLYQTASNRNAHALGDTRERQIPETLKYWGFPPVSPYFMVNEMTIYGYEYVITGDLRTQQVIFLKCYHRYDRGYPDFLYLAYKGGDLVSFDKKRGDTRKLWLAAKAKAEAIKDDKGYYHHNGDKWNHVPDEWLYQWVIEIANEQLG